ncbi:hypothetical protein R5W23_000854 [Gemmata sp. JC673]|uniref:Uncharacterized protein n=1 Tax=Gemmata algarum TaxID=2975278 RepID=A0ABU5EWD3_9BACT|nr:hypothetical protein [Gemmata algarum]MDY3558133.1 hypothetical protein [Gemmata algarum]
MQAVKHTHHLLSDGPTSEIDVCGSVLALMSAGRRVLSGDAGRLYRELLADELHGGALAELLLSTRPVLADSTAHGYVFWEV